MYINIAVLKATQPPERLLKLRPCVADNCDMVYGDAQASLIKMIEAVRGLAA